MLDRYLQPYVSRMMQPVAGLVVKAGVSADAITLTGFLIGMAALPLIAIQSNFLALVCIITNRILDGLDGAVARLTRPTDRGAFIDISLDFFFYSSIPFAFAIANPPLNALPAAALLLAFVGTTTSFLAFAVIAQQRQLRAAAYPTKGIYYLGGLTEGTETILFFAAVCLLPQFFPALAWLFSALCLLTTVTRWWWGWQAFSPGVAR